MRQKKTQNKSSNVRALAAEALQAVHFDGRSLSTVLVSFADKISKPQQPLFYELSYGSVRWYLQLSQIIEQLIEKPIRKKDRMIHYLLIVGLYQLIYTNKPDYAVIKETVDALQNIQKKWAKGLVNAVLRNFLRQKSELLQKIDEFSHPQWFIEYLIEQIGDTKTIHEILRQNNQYPPMWLRVNQQQFPKVEDYHLVLEQHQIDYELNQHQASAILLKSAMDVHKIPYFEQGGVSVQDTSAQWAALLLDAEKQYRMADVCAAPGGKSAHILEHYEDIDLVCLDQDEKRLQKVKDNLKRIKLNANLQCANALQLDNWWDGKPLERLLLDVPCSATGVIRRNPDIKLHRTEQDIENLLKTQQQFLSILWHILKPGGKLLYATCSILQQENSWQIKSFLDQTKDAIELDISLPYGRAMSHGWQIYPGEGNGDGFYYALLQKRQNEAD